MPTQIHHPGPSLQQLAAELAQDVLRPNSDAVDREGAWPAESLKALAAAGLAGLHIPRRLGGHGQGLHTLAVITEELGTACSSTAMCFGMHCVASQVLAARSTLAQEEQFLVPIAEGRHFTSLALSEPGTGIHFYLPTVQVRSDPGGFRLDGEKSFVTSGGHADSYVVSAVLPGHEQDPGAFACLVVSNDSDGVEWMPPWQGFGMRGNSSRGMLLKDVHVPEHHLLGEIGDQIWYIFEVVAPYFIVAISGVYLGIARAALELALAHLQGRSHSHSGERLAEQPILWPQIAELWTDLEASRQLVHFAAREADSGSAGAQRALFAAKGRVADTVCRVTEGAMQLLGGRGYAENGPAARLHRDARAAHVMAPSTHLLNSWLGRSLLDLPLL